MSVITIEIRDIKGPHPCDCCGANTYNVRGFVYEDGDAHAVYFAGWSEGHEDRGVSLAIGLGDWGEGSGVADRYSVGLEARVTDAEIQFAVIDPARSPWGETKFLGRMMERQQALAHPAIKHIFHLAEHIVRDDPRVNAVLEA